MVPESREFTAFLTPWGFYEWVRVVYNLGELKHFASWEYFDLGVLKHFELKNQTK